jgi:hypothetical protein
MKVLSSMAMVTVLLAIVCRDLDMLMLTKGAVTGELLL